LTLPTIAHKWTPVDEQRLRELAAEHTNADIATIMGRSIQSVKSRITLLKLRPSRHFTPAEDAFMQSHYRQLRAKQCAEQLGRTLGSVYRRAAKLGLAEQPKFAQDDELIAVIRELHPLGYSDTEKARVASDRFGCSVDRHRVSDLRRGLGLQTNKQSERFRERVAEKTREQLQEAGLCSLADLRKQRFDQWKRDLGWPEELTVRAVQAIELFYRHGPLTRIQLCELMGVSAKKRTAPNSNAPGGTVLGELARAGLIGRLRKAVAIAGDVELHQQPCKNSKCRRRANETKYIDLYFLNHGVKPSGKTRKHVEAGGSAIATGIDNSRYPSVAGSDASRGSECDRRG
jgi:hypothetical protein